MGSFGGRPVLRRDREGYWSAEVDGRSIVVWRTKVRHLRGDEVSFEVRVDGQYVGATASLSAAAHLAQRHLSGGGRASTNPPRVEVWQQDRDFWRFEGSSEEEDAYATISGFFGPRAVVAEAAYPHAPALQEIVKRSRERVVASVEWVSVGERRRGVGSSLVREALAELSRRGVGRAFLLAIPDSTGGGPTQEQLNAFYRKLGFELVPESARLREAARMFTVRLDGKRASRNPLELNKAYDLAGGYKLLVHRSARGRYPYQGTVVDAGGKPRGHVEADSVEEIEEHFSSSRLDEMGRRLW